MHRMLAFFVVVLWSTLSLAAISGEAVYNGKSVSQWMKLCHSKQKADQLAAMRAYVYFASNNQANPAMFQDLQTACKSDDVEIRLEATEAFGKVAQTSAPYVRTVGVHTLIERMDDPDERVRAVTIRSMSRLAGTDREAVCKQLLHAADHGTPNSQAAAFHSLAAIGNAAPYDPQLLSSIQQGLRSDNAAVRQAAVRAFGALPPTKHTLSQLTDLLTSNDPASRENAAFALADLGEREGAFVDPYLIKELRTAKGTRLAGVLNAVAIMGGDAHATLLEPVLALISSADVEVRKSAITAVGRIGENAPDRITQVLSQRLSAEEKDEIRVAIVRALGAIGSDHPMLVLRPLVLAAKDKSPSVRIAVAGALAAVGSIKPGNGSPRPEGAQASQTLAELLRDTDAEVRCAAAIGLGKFSEHRAGVRDAIAKAQQDPEPAVRAAAAEALGRK